MQKVFLSRLSRGDKQTLGTLSAAIDSGVFVCKTLELAWKDNASNISCIPEGEYLCKWTRSVRLSKLTGSDYYTYEVLGVVGRAGIRIHSANYFTQISGCIALGSALKDINLDGELDTIHSGATVKEFNSAMMGKDFMLVISSVKEEPMMA
jgi:hypothetical protein